jgi:hypothetical protein
MVGCVRQLSSWPFLDGIANLIQSASNYFAIICGGLKSIQGEAAMCNLTQKLTKTVSLKSMFFSKYTTSYNKVEVLA